MKERMKCTECEYYDATPTTLIIRGKRVKAKGWCTRDDCILNEGRYAEVGRIVRCKDCKHWFYFWESEKHHCTESDKHPWDCPIREKDDFCSRGERKGD